jgi:hypothetical protein
MIQRTGADYEKNTCGKVHVTNSRLLTIRRTLQSGKALDDPDRTQEWETVDTQPERRRLTI